jgi:hypothetical protein
MLTVVFYHAGDYYFGSMGRKGTVPSLCILCSTHTDWKKKQVYNPALRSQDSRTYFWGILRMYARIGRPTRELCRSPKVPGFHLSNPSPALCNHLQVSCACPGLPLRLSHMTNRPLPHLAASRSRAPPRQARPLVVGGESLNPRCPILG